MNTTRVRSTVIYNNDNGDGVSLNTRGGMCSLVDFGRSRRGETTQTVSARDNACKRNNARTRLNKLLKKRNGERGPTSRWKRRKKIAGKTDDGGRNDGSRVSCV